MGPYEKIDINDMPFSFQKLIEIQTHKYISSHKSLRPIFNFNAISELNPEYNLRGEIVKFSDSLDFQLDEVKNHLNFFLKIKIRVLLMLISLNMNFLQIFQAYLD